LNPWAAAAPPEPQIPPAEPLLVLASQRRLTGAMDVSSLKTACAKTILRNVRHFTSKPINPFLVLPETLREFILDTTAHYKPKSVAQQAEICDLIKLLIHKDLKRFDFEPCGKFQYQGKNNMK